MSLAGRIDYVIEQGARWYPDVLLWLDSDGNPNDLTNYAAKLQIRATRDAAAALETLSNVGGELTLGGVNGTVQIDLSAVRTKLLTFSRAAYDLLLFPHVGAAIGAATYTSCAIDVNNGSSKGTITATAGDWTTALAAGDYIALDSCENSDTDGIYKIDTVSALVITLTTILGGADNAADTALTVQELNEANRIRLIEGYAMLRKDVTL